MLLLVFGLLASLAWQSPQAPPSSVNAAPQKAAEEKRTELNLLGATDSKAGESRRNENVQFNLIDNNALKDLNFRLGTSATIITEFQPERKYFGTEFGNNPSPVIHLAPLSRSLDFHGGVSFTRSDSIFSARSFFQVGAVQPAHENNYGITGGIRLWRGAHLSLNGSQQNLRGSVNGNVLVPLLSERTPLTTDPALYKLIQKWMSAYPVALPNRPDVDPRALNTNASQTIDTDSTLLRLDQNLGARDKLIAQHSFTNQKVMAFELVAGQNPDTNTKSHNARITWDHLFSAGSELDFTEGFERVHSLLVPEPDAVGPYVQIGTSYQSLGPGGTIPIDRRINRFRQAARFQRRAGNHLFSAGGEVDRLQNNGLESSSERGNFYFRSDFGRDAITNFRLGIASRYSTAVGDGYRAFRWFEQQYFASDVWKVRPDFTVSYGVRYTPQTAPVELHNLTPVDYKCDCNTFAPQLGLAWQTKRLGVVRAAYGLHYGDIYAQTLQQGRWDPPNFLKVEVQAPASILDPLAGVYLGPGARHTQFSVPNNLEAPYSHQYTFLWEPKITGPWALQLGYVGARTHKLFMMWYENRAVPVPGIPQTTATITERRPDPRYYELRQVTNGSNAYFDAARVTLKAPAWRGLTADASYWFSKAIDTGSNYTNMAAGDEARQGYAQSQSPVAQDLKGVSSFDQSHALVVRFQYAVPEVARAGRFMQRVARNWQVNGVFLAKSGLPFTVITGSDGPGSGNVDGSNGDRPNILDPSILGRSVGNPDTSTSLLPRSDFGYIGPADSRGTLGFNTFRRGGIRNMNAALMRSWRLPSDWLTTFKAESINLFNTPQFADPNPDLSSPAFGKITNTLNDGRNFQFTLQLQF
ncbi:MAG TPA: TonB-dependent receptor [Bryobacteraceae bacterium]|jgi:hypothetical protein|nr:TonB-dependent receptor [Bryobacteraceae bacterium]